MEGAETSARDVQQHPRFHEFKNSPSGARWAFTIDELTPTQCGELCEDWMLWLHEEPEPKLPNLEQGATDVTSTGIPSSAAAPADEGKIRCYVLDDNGTDVKELPIPWEDKGEDELCLWDQPSCNAELVLAHVSSASIVMQTIRAGFGGPLDAARMKDARTAVQFVTVESFEQIVLVLMSDLLSMDKLGQDISFNNVVRDEDGRVFHAKVWAVYWMVRYGVIVSAHHAFDLCSLPSSCFSTLGLRTRCIKT